MNIKFKSLLALTALVGVGQTFADCTSSSGSSCSATSLTVDLTGSTTTPLSSGDNVYGQTFYSIRPQYSNVARDQMGTAGRIHQFAKQEFHGDVSVAMQWQQSTNEAELGKWFSFKPNSNTMKYGPNWIEDDNTEEVDINSLHFATTASGTITFAPKVQNFVADLQLYLGFDEFISGLYTRIGVPINYVRTDMNLSEKISTTVAAQTGAGSFLDGDVAYGSTPTVPYSGMVAAFAGSKTVGDIAARTHGNINGRRSEVRVAGLSFELGYDFLRREEGHLGLALRAVAPTGNTPNAEYLFEAVSGANNCWEVGGALSGAYELWSDDNSALNFYVDGNVTHVGRSAQRRLLGLKNIGDGAGSTTTKNSPGASWLLLKRFNSSDDYDDAIIPAANLLSLVVKTGNAVMGDAAASLKYTYHNWAYTLGYNFWGRSKETASAREASKFGDVNYGIKESSNAGAQVDNTLLAAKATTNIAYTDAATGAATIQYLTDADVDVTPALHPAAMTHKVFAAIEHNWCANEWEPYMLVGGSYEIGQSINSTKNSAVNQWGVMAKGGISF